MNDPGLQNLLKWGIQNSEASRADPSAQQQPAQKLDFEALQRFMGGGKEMKSDAELMKDSMAIIKNEEAALENRVIAFQNFQMFIEHLDNANNIENLKLWTPLVEMLNHKEADLRERAAWSCAVAVANNIKTQERLLVVGGIPPLVSLATSDPEKNVRKKAILALSSTARNFQPGLDAMIEHMPQDFKPQQKLDADDMDSVDILINKLRDSL